MLTPKIAQPQIPSSFFPHHSQHVSQPVSNPHPQSCTKPNSQSHIQSNLYSCPRPYSQIHHPSSQTNPQSHSWTHSQMHSQSRSHPQSCSHPQSRSQTLPQSHSQTRPNSQTHSQAHPQSHSHGHLNASNLHLRVIKSASVQRNSHETHNCASNVSPTVTHNVREVHVLYMYSTCTI